MKKMLLILCAHLSMATAIFAQEQSNTDFTVLHDDPYINMARLDVGLLNANLNGFNGNLFTSLGATIVMKDLYVQFAYDLQYLTELNSSNGDAENGMSIYAKPDFFNSFGGIVSYPFYKEELDRDIALNVKNESGSKTFHVPSTYHFGYNIDLGYELGNSLYSFDGSDIKGNEVFSDMTANEASTIEDTDNMSTMFDYSYAVFGISKIKQHFFKGDFKEYGEKSSKGMSRFYGHVLILTSSSVDDLLVEEENNPEVYRRYQLDGTVSMLNIGGRVGWESISMSKIGLTYGVEVGFQPGPVTSVAHNAYIEFRTKLTFGAYTSVK